MKSSDYLLSEGRPGKLSRAGIRKRSRPPTITDELDIENALALLKDAHRLLVTSEAFHAADYVRRAIKSTQGALNHAHRMVAKRQREAACKETPA